MDSKLKVAIIGAGLSGLTTAKSMIEQGLKPFIFEKYNQIGGIWRKDLGNIWSGMHTNGSRYPVSFSDHPWPSSSPLFPSAHEVLQYLYSYVEKFKLDQYIRLNA